MGAGQEKGEREGGHQVFMVGSNAAVAGATMHEAQDKSIREVPV